MTTDGSDASILETDAVVVTNHGDGFVRYISKPVDHGLREAQETAAISKRIFAAEGRRLRMLVDMRSLRSLSREARLYHQSAEQSVYTRAVAFLVDGGLSRVIGNFAVRLNQGPIPIRLFPNEAEAMAWLESLDD